MNRGAVAFVLFYAAAVCGTLLALGLWMKQMMP